MTAQFSKSQFKARALEIMRQVETTGETVIVTDRGRPSIEIRKVASVEADPFALLRGTVLRYDDPFEPVGLEDWEALK